MRWILPASKFSVSFLVSTVGATDKEEIVGTASVLLLPQGNEISSFVFCMA